MSDPSRIPLAGREERLEGRGEEGILKRLFGPTALDKSRMRVQYRNPYMVSQRLTEQEEGGGEAATTEGNDVLSTQAPNDDNGGRSPRSPLSPGEHPILLRLMSGGVVYKPRYFSRYWNVIRWMALLVAGYFFNRFLCSFSIPSDYDRHSLLGHSSNLADLIMFGFIQAWFVEVIDDPKRTAALFKMRRWWFFVCYFGSSLVFALLNDIDVLDHAITSDLHMNKVLLIVYLSLSSVLCSVGVWHVWYASKVLPSSLDVLVYISGRAVILVIFGLTYAVVHLEDNYGPVKFHLHHYFIAWVLSLISTFDHPLSVLFLSITSGVFVQGIGAYSAASIFFRPNEKNWEVDRG